MAPRTTESYIQELTDIYNEHGVEALHCGWLNKHKKLNIYHALRARNITLEDVAKTLDVHEAWEAGKSEPKYTKDTLLEDFERMIVVYKCIPSTGYLTANGYGCLLSALPRVGLTLHDVREHFSDVEDLRRYSRDGRRWASMAEACVVNFLISQNIAVIKGKRYPPEYVEDSGYKSGWYDLHFKATSQAYQGQEVNVEI